MKVVAVTVRLTDWTWLCLTGWCEFMESCQRNGEGKFYVYCILHYGHYVKFSPSVSVSLRCLLA